MNEYFSAISSDNPLAEQPNDWAKMLMSVANQNNVWSAEQAQKQMDFQREMSNTAHQREIADLKAAGLNPVLSAKLGGASTPTGAAGTADSSIVSSLVSLMDKMLDVSGTSAAAAYNATGGSNATYSPSAGSASQGNSSGAKTIAERIEENNPGTEYHGIKDLTSTDGRGILDLLTGNWRSNEAKKVEDAWIAGIRGQELPKNNTATGTYAIAHDMKNFPENTSNSKPTQTALKINESAKGLVDGFMNWLKTGVTSKGNKNNFDTSKQSSYKTGTGSAKGVSVSAGKSYKGNGGR